MSDQSEDGAFSPKLIPTKINGQSHDYASDASDVPAEEDDDAYGWGTSRKDYYDADPITTEADALEEEAEARRLQKRQLQGMTEADFGFDEVDWTQAGKSSMTDGDHGVKGKVISEVLPTVEITDCMSAEEKLKILRLRYPEFEPLAKEYAELQAVYQDLSLESKAASAVDNIGKEGGSTIAALKLNALGGYLAALCMYFAILSAIDTTTDAVSGALTAAELHEHQIMGTLVKCRELWEKVKNVKIPDAKYLQTLATNSHPAPINGEADATDPQTAKDPITKPRIRKSHSARRAARALATAQAESEARRLERLRRTEESLKDLSALPALRQTLTKSPINAATKGVTDNDQDSDLGEPNSLTPYEAAQKAARKKSLRFYTSQIAQKSNRRDAAGRDAGGDADIPYRERLRDRQMRLNVEAEARGKKKGREDGAGVPLDSAQAGDNDEEEQQNIARIVRNDEDEDYYNLVSSRAAAKKTIKSMHARAAREGGNVRIFDNEMEVGADGKRGISYAIEKIRG